MGYATITLELFKSGIKASCEDCNEEEFIPRGDGDKLMDFINNVDDFCHPDTTFTITEKGRDFFNQLKDATT